MTQVGVLIGHAQLHVARAGPRRRRSITAATSSPSALVFYELLAYRQAFQADSQAAVLHRIMTAFPEPLAEALPDIDPGLSALVDRLLAKSPADRPPDLTVVRQEIARLTLKIEAGQEEHTVVGAPAPATPPPTPSGRVHADRGRLAERRAARLAQHLQAAEAALAAGDLDEALVETELAAESDPQDPRVLRLHDRCAAGSTPGRRRRCSRGRAAISTRRS